MEKDETRKNGMLGKTQTPATKEKISQKQKLRHAIYRRALQESGMKDLKLKKTKARPTNMEDEMFEAKFRVIDNFFSLIDEIFDLKEIEQALFHPEDTPSYLNMYNVNVDDIDEKVNESVRHTINKFLINECSNGKDK